MDLDELKEQWQKLDAKVQLGLRLDARLLREVTSAQTRSFVGGELWRRMPLLLLDLLAVVWLGSFAADHAHELRFFVPALVLMAFAVFMLAAGVRQLALLRGVDYSAPVLRHQRQLGQLRLERLRVTKLVLLAAPLLWTPLLIVALEALFAVDAYRLFGAWYIVANLALGIAAIPILLWLARRYGERLARRPLLRRLADDVAGRNLTAALEHLASLAAFAEEAE
jgi:hypothetical protein